MEHRVAYHATIAAEGTEVIVSPQMVARWKPPQSIAHLGEYQAFQFTFLT
jgi:hypothetical protein